MIAERRKEKEERRKKKGERKVKLVSASAQYIMSLSIKRIKFSQKTNIILILSTMLI